MIIGLTKILTRRNLVYLIGGLLLYVQGCAKYVEFEAVFPPENNTLAKYQKIVIVNSDRGKHLNDLMENALKTQLTSIYPGNVKPGKAIDKIGTEIKLFNYNPKIMSTPEEKTAYLSYDLKADEKLNRQRTTSRVPLQSCDYLRKKNPCRITGSASLASGTQTLTVILTGKIHLNDGTGNAIIPTAPIQKTLTDSGKIIKTPSNLIFSAINQVAVDYAKRIIPYKRITSSEILRGGDTVSVKLIENKAFGLAINRLDKIVTNNDDPDFEDYYNLGLSYEALNELRPALEYYLRADERESGNAVIQASLKRVRRIVQE